MGTSPNMQRKPIRNLVFPPSMRSRDREIVVKSISSRLSAIRKVSFRLHAPIYPVDPDLNDDLEMVKAKARKHGPRIQIDPESIAHFGLEPKDLKMMTVNHKTDHID
jgi:hypothetical protein